MMRRTFDGEMAMMTISRTTRIFRSKSSFPTLIFLLVALAYSIIEQCSAGNLLEGAHAWWWRKKTGLPDAVALVLGDILDDEASRATD